MRLLRESKKLSQEQMAEKLNISQQAYSNLENNPEIITVQRLKKVAEIFEVPASTLINDENTFRESTFLNLGIPKEIQVNRIEIAESRIYENHIKDLNDQIAFLSELLLKQVKSN